MHFEVAQIYMCIHTLSLNLHTVPNPKRVLKTELGSTQHFLPPDMTILCTRDILLLNFRFNKPIIS